MKLLVLSSALAALATATSRVVDASDSSYKFTTRIVKTFQSQKSSCTAVFLSPTILLAPATCVTETIGDNILSYSNIAIGDNASPVNIIVHPGYNSQAHADNVALVFVANQISNATVQIQKQLPSAGNRLVAAGWGDAKLGAATVKVADSAECTRAWKPFKNAKNQVCVQSTTGTKGDACDGDGALVADDGKSVALVGLLNLYATEDRGDDAKCNDKSVFDFYTAAENYIGWITQNTPLKARDVTFSGEIGESKEEESSSEDESSDGSSEENSSDMDSVESDDSSAHALAASIVSIAAASLSVLVIDILA